jgi:hypothetical protein
MHAGNECDEEGEITVTSATIKRARIRASMEEVVDLTED